MTTLAAVADLATAAALLQAAWGLAPALLASQPVQRGLARMAPYWPCPHASPEETAALLQRSYRCGAFGAAGLFSERGRRRVRSMDDGFTCNLHSIPTMCTESLSH